MLKFGGHPTTGVSSGNVLVYISTSSDIPFAVYHILYFKTFYNGSVCVSEQAIIVKKDDVELVVDKFKKQGAYFMKRK